MGRITTDRLPTRTGYGAAGRLLVAGTVVLALGLGAVMASPASLPEDRGDLARPRPPVVIDGGDTPFRHPSPEDPARPPAMLRRPAGEAQDRRAFLLDTAIQVHAPASAPAPRRSAPPHPHGVD